MLSCSCQLIKQSRLSAILVTDECIGQYRPFRNRILMIPGMIFSTLTESRMIGILTLFNSPMISGSFLDLFNLNFFCFRKPERQFIAMNLYLHRIPHRSKLYYRHLCPRNHTHIKKVLT